MIIKLSYKQKKRITNLSDGAFLAYRYGNLKHRQLQGTVRQSQVIILSVNEGNAVEFQGEE